MKVVQELVAYFDRRGRLGRRRIKALLDQGMLAGEAPPNLVELGDQVGASYYFRVRGDAAAGQVWGSEIYTGDSALAAAAVHAGLVAQGATAVVRVTIAAPPAQFHGSVCNGVASHDFGRFGSAYTLAAV